MRSEIVKLRKEKRLDRKSLATKLGISESMVTKVENGVRRPSVEIATEWGKQIGVPTEKVLPYFYAIG